MEIRNSIIERILRMVYAGQPTEDSSITYELVNRFLNDGCAIAAQKNYTDNIAIEGTGYINNSFYCTYSGIPIVQDPTNNLGWMFQLPQIPLAFDKTQGISRLRFYRNGFTSFDGVPISQNQASYFDRMPPIQNKVVYLPEGVYVRCKATFPLSLWTSTVTMVSAGDSTDLNSILNIPDDYMPIVIDYCVKELAWERSQPRNTGNDGEDIPTQPEQ
jgi:hypothetical protein